MCKEHIAKIVENMVWMDGDPSTLTDRVEAHEDAVAEVRAALVASKVEGEALSPEEERMIEWAVDYVYRAGVEYAPDDIVRHVEIDAGYRKHHKDNTGEWVPETADDILMTVPYVQLVSMLSHQDKTPAFKASQQGRRHEILDDPNDVYNKYGELVTHLQ